MSLSLRLHLTSYSMLMLYLRLRGVWQGRQQHFRKFYSFISSDYAIFFSGIYCHVYVWSLEYVNTGIHLIQFYRCSSAKPHFSTLLHKRLLLLQRYFHALARVYHAPDVVPKVCIITAKGVSAILWCFTILDYANLYHCQQRDDGVPVQNGGVTSHTTLNPRQIIAALEHPVVPPPGVDYLALFSPTDPHYDPLPPMAPPPPAGRLSFIFVVFHYWTVWLFRILVLTVCIWGQAYFYICQARKIYCVNINPTQTVMIQW